MIKLIKKLTVKNPGDQTIEQKLEPQAKCLAEEVERLQNQVLVLEEELQKQKRLKVAFKVHAGNLGDYLRLCLQALEAKGIHECMLRESLAQPKDEKNKDQQVSSLTEQACRCGWYIPAHEKSVDSFCQELEVLSRVRHPNVVQFLGACISLPNKAWIVMEYMSFGTLTEWLHGSKKRSSTRIIPLPPLHQRLHVALGIAQAMQYLHECNPRILHRDLKPSNIFMDKRGTIRIADFGFAKLLNDGAHSALTGETGTYIYMAPEVVRHEPYNDKCDVYSFGVLLCELITGDPPYIDRQLTPFEVALAVAQGTMRPSLPEGIGGMHSIDKTLTELIRCMWDHDPAKRPSFAMITLVLKGHMPAA